MSENVIFDFDEVDNESDTRTKGGAKPRARADRVTETRAVDKRPQSWVAPEALPTPLERPGFVHRWVATAVQGTTAETNLSARLREGWVPCKAEDYPEIVMVANPGNQYFKDNVVIGSLMLCRMPTEFVQQRADTYAQRARSMEEGVDSQLESAVSSRVPLTRTRNSTTSFGSGGQR